MRILLAATASILGLSAPAMAQTAVAEGTPPGPTQGTRTTVYDSAFFAQYAPRTALDIARRVPGFNLDLGNDNVRGFAGAAGNVVINGARPSSKAESLETTLSRIPANRVSKIEVGPGDLYGADYSSKSQVLNILMSAAGGVDANVTGSARRLYTGKIVPDGSASALIRRGASSINLSGGFGNSLNHEEGTDTITLLSDGSFRQLRTKFNSYHNFNPYLSGSWALERAQDNATRLNGRWSPQQFDLWQDNRVRHADGFEHDDSLIQDYDNPVFELGGDVTRPLAGGAIKLVGLATRRKRNNFDAAIVRNGLLADGAVQTGGFEQTQEARLNETLARLSWTRQDFAGFSVEAGVEGVLNTLDNELNLVVIRSDGSRVPIDLPVENAQVEEKRAEGFLNVGKNLSPALRVDTGMRYETSHLLVTGDASADRKLSFFKPSLTVDWKPGGGWHTQFSVKRTVAQLNFYDFVSVAELSNDRINGGNAELQPQRAWEFRLTTDRPLLGDGQIRLALGYDYISMLQDRTLIRDPDTGLFFDAPGNIGTGTHAFARLDIDAPLGRLWEGLRVKANGTVRRTRVEDPVSGKKRNFTDYYPNWEWYVEARRDKGPFSYGFTVQDRARFTFFRTDEYDINYNAGLYGTAFVEYRPSPRTSITLDVDNALNTQAVRRRILFTPDRLDPKLVENELRERNRHPNVGITIKQTFGGGGAKP